MPNFGAIFSNLAAPLANTVAAHNVAQTAANDKLHQQILAELARERQDRLDQQARFLNESVVNRNNAEATKALMPPVRNIDPNSVEGIQAAINKAKGIAALKPAPLDPIKVHEANRLFDVKHPVPVQPSYTPVTLGGNDGTPPHVVPFNTKAGTVGMPIGDKPPASGSSSASLSPEDRQKMVNQARLDNETMKAYEAKMMASGKSVGMATGIAGAAAGSPGTGVLGQITGIIGNKATGAIDPEYQRYITAQRSYGRIMGNLQSKRYTDHQAEIERSISGLQGGDLSSTIQYKQQLRDASLADVASGGGRGGGVGTPQTPATPKAATREQQLWDAAVAKHGRAKVLQEFGPRPGGDE